MSIKFSYLFSFLLLILQVQTTVEKSAYPYLHCRDPDLGNGRDQAKNRKFLLISGHGGGIGNYLIFYPAAFYFAAITGRDILITDGSLIAEMCSVIQCGFPLYSEAQAAFPALLTEKPSYRPYKVWDFKRHLFGEGLLEDRVIQADGYKYASGWYHEHNYSDWCVRKLSGCRSGDISCEDRYAYQKLIRGPFKSQAHSDFFRYLVGVPPNLKKGILSLPHALAPRLDAAVHLRCQFKHFEYLVGPDDSLWPQYVKEVNDFLHSTAPNAGMQLFRIIEEKIVEELQTILDERKRQREHRKLLLEPVRGVLSSINSDSGNNLSQAEWLAEHDLYHGDSSDRVYIYLGSDNDQVKEAFAAYMVNHANVSVMRVKTGQTIVHAKDVNYLKRNDSGVFTLVMDWYAFSLANVVFAWRRDTAMISTFAQSAQRASGMSLSEKDDPFEQPEPTLAPVAVSNGAVVGKGVEERGDSQRSKGYHLHFKNYRAHWKEF